MTRVALEAGYETHESFTRAFRDAYSISPTEFRERARALTSGCAARVPHEIAAPCGVHYPPDFASALVICSNTRRAA